MIELDDEWLVMDQQQFTMTVLNETGGLCWSMLHEPLSIQQLIEFLRAHYALEEEAWAEQGETIRQDIHGFVSQLMNLGLIQYAS